VNHLNKIFLVERLQNQMTVVKQFIKVEDNPAQVHITKLHNASHFLFLTLFPFIINSSIG